MGRFWVLKDKLPEFADGSHVRRRRQFFNCPNKSVNGAVIYPNEITEWATMRTLET